MGIMDLTFGPVRRDRGEKPCIRCKRRLNVDCFPVDSSEPERQSRPRSGVDSTHDSFCRVCTYIVKREESAIRVALSKSSEILGKLGKLF